MLNEKILKADLPKIKFGEDTESIYSFLQKEQLKKKNLWKHLVEQFIIQPDSKDGGWRGEFWGKMMRGACITYAHTLDEDLYSILFETVNDLLATQDSFGRISSYKKEKEFYGWDMWCRKYVMLGLEFYLDIAKDNDQKQRVITALTKHADYIMENINSEKLPINRTSGMWGCTNSYSILQPFVKLFKITGDNKYKNYAIDLIKNQDVEGMNLFARAFENKIPPYRYSVIKAYEVASCFEGLLEFYEVCGDEKCLTAVKNYADSLLATDFTIVGGTGCRHELLDNSTRRQVLHDHIEAQETCVTVTLLKLLSNLYKHTGDKTYIDAIERAYYNVFVGAINKDFKTNKQPVVLSYSPLLHNARGKEIGGKKKITKSTFCGCCISIASAGLIALNNSSATLDNGVLTLNYLGSAEYEFNSGVKLSVSSGYPDNGNVKVEFLTVPTDGVKFKLRVPDWCESFKAELSGKNGYNNSACGYIVFDGVVSGDKITFTMDMPFRLIDSTTVNPDVDYRKALAKGPIVFACDKYPHDDVIDFDENNLAVETSNNGKINLYTVSLKNGNSIVMKKYSDSGKDDFLRQSMSVWLRTK